jgi:hypothetical protein
MPSPAFPEIDHARVQTVRLAQRVTQTELIGRDEDQVYMIRHEAVEQNVRASRPTSKTSTAIADTRRRPHPQKKVRWRR